MAPNVPYLERSPLMFGIFVVPSSSHSSNIFVSSLGRPFPFPLLNRERNIRLDVYGSPIHRGFGSSIVHSTFSGQPLHTSVDLAPYFSPLAYMDVVGSRDYPTRKRFVGTISPNTTTPPPTPRLSISSSSFETLS